MTHDTPTKREAIAHPLKGLDQPFPSRHNVVFEGLKVNLEITQQLANRGHDVFGLNAIEFGQPTPVQ